MTDKETTIASTLIPQSNYRKSMSKPLNKLITTIPSIGKTHPHKKAIIEKINTLILAIHTVALKSPLSGKTLQNKITKQLFQITTESIHLDDLWNTIELPIINYIKVYYLTHHIESLILNHEKQVEFLINKYKRHLPNHISSIESDDLKTIAQLELIETFKAWNPEKKTDIWPLAYTRINGAMKDHIRYISKSDPTRFYDWATDAAYLYMAINNDTSHEHQIETSSELDWALKILTKKEQEIIKLYVNEDLTFSEISKKIQLSESQISRIYKKAIKKLKSKLD